MSEPSALPTPTPVTHRQPCGCVIELATVPGLECVDLELLQTHLCPLHQSAQSVLTALTNLLDTMPTPQGDVALVINYEHAQRVLRQAQGRDPVAANTHRMYAALLTAQRAAEHDCRSCQRGYHCQAYNNLQERAAGLRMDVLARITVQEQAHGTCEAQVHGG